MADPDPALLDRLAAAREEAEALVWYYARHCPGGLDAQASEAYSVLLNALSQAATQADEDSYKSLMEAYRGLSCHTFEAHGVHGRSILDTTRKPAGLRARLWDKRYRSVTLGGVFFVAAVLLQLLDAWTDSKLPLLPADSSGGDTAPAVPVGLSLLGSCVPLLIPVAWGALGACTALAKRVSDRLTAMSYEENRMQGLPARIFLGAALALVLDILVFVERSPSAEEVAGLGFGPIVAAFLAGLFVQHIYGAFEALMRRVSRAISPESSAPPAPPPVVRPPRDM